MKNLLTTFRNYLPIISNASSLSLGEGDTPLVHAPAVSRETGADVWLKLEGCNPTGSFKDRGMVVAIAKAVEEKSRAVICASTGNTAASAAAYAARAGLMCAVVIPSGKIALGKLSQAMMHHARVLPIEGNFDQALTLVRELAEQGSITLVNSVNPYRIEGQKTGAFEIVDALGDAPDILTLPVGNAGNITAYWRGFNEYHRAGKSSRLPKIFGFQAAGAAPIVNGAPVENPQTVATAICIGNPASWRGAVNARDESGGLIEVVTDEEILAAYHFLAEREGVFCEPASAAGLAGIMKLKKQNPPSVPAGARIVCVLTGNGLKDPDNAIVHVEIPRAISASIESLAKALEL